MVITSIQFHQLYLHKFLPCIRANQISHVHFPFQASHTLVNNIYSNIQSRAHIHCNIFSSTTYTSNNSTPQFHSSIQVSHNLINNLYFQHSIKGTYTLHNNDTLFINIITPPCTTRSNNHHINSSPTFI